MRLLFGDGGDDATLLETNLRQRLGISKLIETVEVKAVGDALSASFRLSLRDLLTVEAWPSRIVLLRLTGIIGEQSSYWLEITEEEAITQLADLGKQLPRFRARAEEAARADNVSKGPWIRELPVQGELRRTLLECAELIFLTSCERMKPKRAAMTKALWDASVFLDSHLLPSKQLPVSLVEVLNCIDGMIAYHAAELAAQADRLDDGNVPIH